MVFIVMEHEADKDKKKKRDIVSCREFYCYIFQIKGGVQFIHTIGGRLTQQFAVDMYIKVETTRLEFHRSEQDKLRNEFLQGIVDSINAGETRGDQIGKRIVLPTSFIGGPRDMRRRYLDAMALVQQFGKPDLFITMTCNPDWKEIKQELRQGELAQDRPDLTSRIFRAKLYDLKDQIFKKEIFGKVAAHVHVIEFQKRGLPHCHMLIILQAEYKITRPEQFDKFISAEIPDRENYPVLYEIVVKQMMHGPCGDDNPKNSCMIKKKEEDKAQCRFHYPRAFSSNTLIGKDGYPIYKRSKNNRQVSNFLKIIIHVFHNRFTYIEEHFSCK